MKTLERVHSGELPFDRTIKVSLTERLTKEQVQARMPHNLPLLRHLMAGQQQRDFALLTSRRATAGRQGGGPRPLHPPPRKDAHAGRGAEPADAPRAAAHPAARRNVAPHGRAQAAARRAPRDGRPGRQDRLGPPRAARADAAHARKPGQPAPPQPAASRPVPGVRRRQARALQRQPAAGGLDRQEVPQPRPAASWTSSRKATRA